MNDETPNFDPAAAETAAAAAETAAEKAALAAAKAAEKEAIKVAKAAEKAMKAAEKEAIKAAAAAEKEAKAAEKGAIKAAAAAEKEAKTARRTDRVYQNGVRMPLPEGKCGQAWALFNELGAQLGRVPTIAEALPIGEARGQNPGNIRVEYSFWRKFYGIAVIRTVKAVAEPVAAEPVAEFEINHPEPMFAE